MQRCKNLKGLLNWYKKVTHGKLKGTLVRSVYRFYLTAENFKIYSLHWLTRHASTGRHCFVSSWGTYAILCRSHASHRFLLRLRSKEFGGQVNTLNSFICSSNKGLYLMFVVCNNVVSKETSTWMPGHRVFQLSSAQSVPLPPLFWRCPYRHNLALVQSRSDHYAWLFSLLPTHHLQQLIVHLLLVKSHPISQCHNNKIISVNHCHSQYGLYVNVGIASN